MKPLFGEALLILRRAEELQKINSYYQQTLVEQAGMTADIVELAEKLCRKLGLIDSELSDEEQIAKDKETERQVDEILEGKYEN